MDAEGWPINQQSVAARVTGLDDDGDSSETTSDGGNLGKLLHKASLLTTFPLLVNII